MVKEIRQGGSVVYQCEDCRLKYHEKLWAEQCEKWCRENHTRNVVITKHRIKYPD